MCLEIYHPEMPIQIGYEHEVIEFTGAFEFTTRYTFIVMNRGNKPIDRLYALYPRGLFGLPVRKHFPWHQPKDITDILGPGVNEHLQPPVTTPAGPTLTMVMPDPNRPQFDREPLTGLWLPSSTCRWEIPRVFDKDCISMLRKADFTAWMLNLGSHPLQPQQARWFWWEIKVQGAGIPLGRTPIGGKAVLHQLASPVDVRRTFVEVFESGLRRSEAQNDKFTASICSRILDSLGLRFERRVDIQYYELAIWPGKAVDRLIVSWQMDRDLRMRTGSPRLGSDPLGREPRGEPIYEWKSGSLLQPDHAWKDEGFILHLMLAHG